MGIGAASLQWNSIFLTTFSYPFHILMENIKMTFSFCTLSKMIFLFPNWKSVQYHKCCIFETFQNGFVCLKEFIKFPVSVNIKGTQFFKMQNIKSCTCMKVEHLLVDDDSPGWCWSTSSMTLLEPEWSSDLDIIHTDPALLIL